MALNAAPTSALSVSTPCIAVCRVDARTKQCTGCYRTVDEICAWPSLTEAERQRIMGTLAARR
jgi:uncharacterized protein